MHQYTEAKPKRLVDMFESNVFDFMNNEDDDMMNGE